MMSKELVHKYVHISYLVMLNVATILCIWVIEDLKIAFTLYSLLWLNESWIEPLVEKLINRGVGNDD